MRIFAIALLVSLSIMKLSSSETNNATAPVWDERYQLCYKLLRISPKVLEQLELENLNQLEGPIACLIRCVLITTGIYEDETGINMEQVAVWFARNAEFEEFRRSYVECAEKIKPEQYGDDYCKKSVKFFACYVGDT